MLYLIQTRKRLGFRILLGLDFSGSWRSFGNRGGAFFCFTDLAFLDCLGIYFSNGGFLVELSEGFFPLNDRGDIHSLANEKERAIDSRCLGDDFWEGPLGYLGNHRLLEFTVGDA